MLSTAFGLRIATTDGTIPMLTTQLSNCNIYCVTLIVCCRVYAWRHLNLLFVLQKINLTLFYKFMQILKTNSF